MTLKKPKKKPYKLLAIRKVRHCLAMLSTIKANVSDPTSLSL